MWSTNKDVVVIKDQKIQRIKEWIVTWVDVTRFQVNINIGSGCSCYCWNAGSRSRRRGRRPLLCCALVLGHGVCHWSIAGGDKIIAVIIVLWRPALHLSTHVTGLPGHSAVISSRGWLLVSAHSLTQLTHSSSSLTPSSCWGCWWRWGCSASLWQWHWALSTPFELLDIAIWEKISRYRGIEKWVLLW